VTVVAGIEMAQGVLLIADSCESEDGGYLDVLSPGAKLLPFGEDTDTPQWALALAGSSRASQVYRYELPQHVTSVPPTEFSNVERWIVRDVVAGLFAVGEAHDVLEPHDPKRDTAKLAVCGLVAVRGALWHLSSCGAVTRTEDGYSAAGSGRHAALAAMDALGRISPKRRIRKAVEVAARREPGVSAPFHELWVPA
jgi:hypothetical protein